MARRQSGFVLPLLLVLVAVTVVTLLAGQLLGKSPQASRAEQTTIALAQAKAALLASALSGDLSNAENLYGVLPCPDFGLGASPEGSESVNCGSAFVNSLGRLPRQSLKLERAADGDNECLWYAVSGRHKASGFRGSIARSAAADSLMLNEDTPALLRAVDANGAALAGDSQIVAVVFAPGAILSGQDRSPSATHKVDLCGGNYTASNYLDRAAALNNAAAVTSAAKSLATFVQAPASDTFTDRLLPITRKEVFDAVGRRKDFQENMTQLAQALAECLRTANPFPPAANTHLGSGWDSYAQTASYGPTSGRLTGRVPAQWVQEKLRDKACVLPEPLSLLYRHWQDHFFYALAAPFAVKADPESRSAALCAGDCLTVNGGNTSYAAIVFFTGMRLAHQTRADAALGDVTQYLEGCNASNFTGTVSTPCSPRDYVKGAATDLFNDVLVCIPADSAQPIPLSCS